VKPTIRLGGKRSPSLQRIELPIRRSTDEQTHARPQVRAQIRQVHPVLDRDQERDIERS
jgi:hypothetical protein